MRSINFCKNSKISISIIIAFLLMILTSCGGGGGGSSSPGGSSLVTIKVDGDGRTASLKIQKNTLLARAIRHINDFVKPNTAIAAIPADVTTISFTISASDITTISKDVLVLGQTSITETFTVANGTSRYFLVEAKNAAGGILYIGSTNADLSGGTVTLNIIMATLYNATAAAQYVSDALTYFTNNDITNASIAYEKAIVADPTNKDANFGGALTKVVMLIDDPTIRDILTKWQAVLEPSANQILTNASPIGNPFQTWSNAISNVNVTGGPVVLAAARTTSSPDAVEAVAAAYSKLKAILPKAAPQGSLARFTTKIAATLLPATAPTVSEMQTTISGVVLPALNEALARLKKVEGAGYTFTNTKAMQGNPVSGMDITMNDGEFYALETAINAFICMLNVAISYDLDVPDADGNGTRNDYDKAKQDPLKIINDQSTFFTLKSTGAASMQAGLKALQDGVTALDKAYAIVKTRTAANTAAGQGAFDLTNLAATDRTDFEKFLVYAKEAIVGQTDILYDQDTRTVTVDIAKFFTNPLDRTDLPTLGYDVQPDAALSATYNYPVAATYGTAPYTSTIDSVIVPKSDIPDYTLNGILPSNSPSNNVADFTGILPVLDSKLITPPSGMDPLLFAQSLNLSTTTKSVGTSSAEIYFSTNTGTTTAVYKFDATTGAFSQLCSSVEGIPTYYYPVTGVLTSYGYWGLQYYSNPQGIYARIYKITATGTDFEYRPITVANQICTIESTSVKTISIPAGRPWTLEYVGAGVDMVVHYIDIVSTPSYSFKLYSSTDPTKVLLELTDPNKLLIGTSYRNGFFYLRHNVRRGVLLEYQVASDGISASQTGRFTNVAFTGYSSNGPYPPLQKLFVTHGGYHWLFDGVKMYKYAMKPDGTVP